MTDTNLVEYADGVERPAHSHLGASGAERQFRQHPTLPVLACACGDIFNANTGKRIKHRADKDGYRIFDIGSRVDKKTVRVHRVVKAAFDGESDMEVDHEDRDRANNAYLNLIYKTISANRRNIGVRRHSTSGIRNVRQRNGRWQAYRTVDGKFKSLGQFDTAEEAKRAAEIHYGN